MATTTDIITRPGSRVSIRKPTHGGYCAPNNFGRNWTSAETEATRWRDVYVDGELVGSVEKQDGLWYVDVEGFDTFALVGGFRSAQKALAQIEERIPAAAVTLAASVTEDERTILDETSIGRSASEIAVLTMFPIGKVRRLLKQMERAGMVSRFDHTYREGGRVSILWSAEDGYR